jgi:hypothetical protein
LKPVIQRRCGHGLRQSSVSESIQAKVKNFKNLISTVLNEVLPLDLNDFYHKCDKEHYEEYWPSLETLSELFRLKENVVTSNDKEAITRVELEIGLLNGIIDGDLWKWCLDNINKPFPKWQIEWVDALKLRAEVCRASLPKARYYYALWTLTKEIGYAKQAINQFIQAGKLHINDPAYIPTYSFCFKMSLKMAISLNIKLENTIGEVLSTLKEVAGKDLTGPATFRLLGVFSEFADSASPNIIRKPEITTLIEDVVSVGERFIEGAKSKDEFHFEQTALNFIAILQRSLGKTDLAKEAKLKQVSSLEHIAKSIDSYLLKTTLLESALNICVEIGASDKIDELKKSVQEASGEALKEFKIIEVKTEIPQEVIQKMVSEYSNLEPITALEKIVLNDGFVPRLESIKKEVESLRKTHPISSIFPLKIYNNGLPRRVVETEEDKTEYEINRHFQLGVSFTMSFLSKILETLKIKSLNKEVLLEYLKTKKNIDSESLIFIDNALKLYFSKNYVGAIHILVPRVEVILRNLLQNHGKSPTKYDVLDRGMDYKLLSDLISDAKLFIGEDLTKFLEVTLTQQGENIRNDVCHGYLEINCFTVELTNILLFIIMKLADI